MFLLTDAQVPEEEFLVVINDLLASGEIPELFPDDEVEGIINGLRNEVKGAGMQDTNENCWRFFIDRVRRQLKVRTYVCTYIQYNLYIYVCTCIHAYMHTYVHTFIHIHMYAPLTVVIGSSLRNCSLHLYSEMCMSSSSFPPQGGAVFLSRWCHSACEKPEVPCCCELHIH